MTATPFYLLTLCLPAVSLARGLAPAPPPNPLSRRSSVPSAGFYDPTDSGGSWLTKVNGTFPAGLGEPINMVISAASDTAVLVDQQTDGGLLNYYLSFDFTGECLGQHQGSDQQANLGDGNDYLNETAVMRYDYGDAAVGTCKESVQGGNHFRYWIQDGSNADSGAIFMAVSYELPIAQEHDIIFNGYNLARDWLVGNATNQSSLIPTSSLTNESTYSGQTTYNDYTYETSVSYVSGYLTNTSDGINHQYSVGANGTNAVDGLVAVMTVKIISKPASSSGVMRLSLPLSWLSPSALAVLLSFISLSLFL